LPDLLLRHACIAADEENSMLGTISRLRGRSFGELLELGALNLRHAVAMARPSKRARRAADEAFDREWGTETSRAVSVHDLGIGRARIAHCNRYEASSEMMLQGPLATLAINPEEYDFIDYGAGKGRVMMLALQAGFRSVTGIELSTRLCAAAQANLDQFSSRFDARPRARVIGADATMYMPAGQNILAYFYNPFDASIMAVVRQRLEEALRDGTEQVVVVYANPEHFSAFTTAPGWAEGPDSPGVRTFVATAGSFQSATLAA
jgi:SAM-dependent methyltransferase